MNALYFYLDHSDTCLGKGQAGKTDSTTTDPYDQLKVRNLNVDVLIDTVLG